MKFISIIDINGKFYLLNSRYIVSVEITTFTGGENKGETFTRIDYKRSIQATTIYTKKPFHMVSGELLQANKL